MRLIDADALRASLVPDPYNSTMMNGVRFGGRNGGKTLSMVMSAMEYMITQAPTIDAEPVRHGRWIAVPSSDMMTGKAYKCSECNKMRYGSFMPNYCQNCGAKMGGDPDV